MLKQNMILRKTFADLANINSQEGVRIKNEILFNPKNLPSKPASIIIPKKTTQYDKELLASPKTARNPQENRYFKNNSFHSKSINATPQKRKKEYEKNDIYITNFKKNVEKIQTKEQNSFSERKRGKQMTQRNMNNQFSKTCNLNDISNLKSGIEKQKPQAIIRQTISQSYMKKLSKLTQLIKATDQLKKVEKQYEKKKGNENQHTTSKFQKSYFPNQNLEEVKEINFFKKKHLKTNSNLPQNYIEPLSFKSKFAFHSAKTSLNASTIQQAKVDSARLNKQKVPPLFLMKQKSMSQTDPSGSYFHLALSTRSSLQDSNRKSQYVQAKIEDFEVGSCKGEGRFGKVFLARHKKTGFLLALKQIKKQSIKYMIEQFIQEVKIHLFLNHPNIVKMYGYFHDKQTIYIMMEYMDEGSLYKYIKMNNKLTEDDASFKLYQICSAVKYMHSFQVLHRDIKPQNIVMSNGVCKLCDFGWAVYSKQRRQTYCGTLDYVCPEILEGQFYDKFVDIWAIGVLIYEMIIGKAPFYHISRKETMRNIMNCDFNLPKDISSAAKKFILKTLQKNPDQRVGIDELLRDVFLRKWNVEN